jgi:hemerythrin
MHFSEKMVDGVAEIDDQHRGLIDIINELYEIALKRAGQRTLEDVFEALDVYTKDHFEREESLFAKHGYPGLADHKAQHNGLLQTIVDYRKRPREGQEFLLALELLHHLKQWLSQHMITADRQACAYLNEQGVY